MTCVSPLQHLNWFAHVCSTRDLPSSRRHASRLSTAFPGALSFGSDPLREPCQQVHIHAHTLRDKTESNLRHLVRCATSDMSSSVHFPSLVFLVSAGGAEGMNP